MHNDAWSLSKSDLCKNFFLGNFNALLKTYFFLQISEIEVAKKFNLVRHKVPEGTFQGGFGKGLLKI